MAAFGKPLEELYRHDIKQFNRKPITEITDLQGMEDFLEPVRIAPSAINQQGWYFSGEKNKIRLYMNAGNFLIQKLMEPMKLADSGVALCHLWITAQKNNRFSSFEQEKGIQAHKKCRYIWTLNLNT
jgi:hypothetical protein